MASMEPVSVLKDVVAYVEVRSNNDNRSAAVCKELEALGAKVEASFTDDVTHVVYKEGLRRTYVKAQKKVIPLVSVSWLESCKRNQTKMPEADFIPLVEKEPDNPLIKMKQNRRWKKMKSMQPCDFDEEVARSAERNKKQRRRIELANRFKLAEDATPPGGSPAMVLALDTQARSSSPFFGNTSRFSSSFESVVPDTPATPTMKERIEKMMREQKNVIGAGVDSPKSSVLETAMLQRKLFEKLAKDIFKVDSSDDDDGGETTARVVAKLVEGLGNSSGMSTPLASGGGRLNAEEQESDDKEVESIFLSKSPHNSKPNSSLSVDHANDVGNNPAKSTPRSDRKSLSCRKESGKKKGAELVREARQSTGSSSDESFVLSPMCPNRVPPLGADSCVTELATDLEADTMARVSNAGASAVKSGTQLEASGSKNKGKKLSVEGTPKSTKAVRKTECQPRKPKTVNKRKLFSDPIFSMAVLPVEEKDGSSKDSPEAPSSNAPALPANEKRNISKRKRNTEAAEVSFLFSGATGADKTGGEVTATTPRRRSQRLSINNSLSLSSVKGTKVKDQTAGSRKSLSTTISNSVIADPNSTTMRQTRRSLGTSMSVLYGTDVTMLNSSTDHPSRRSIDEFSSGLSRARNKKIVAENKNTKQTSKPQMKKSYKCDGDSLQGSVLKKQISLKDIKVESETSSNPPTKRRKGNKSMADVKQASDSRVNGDSGSDTPTEKPASPCALRHANSLVMESVVGKTTGRRPTSLVMTSLHRDEQDVVQAVVKKLGVFKLVDKVDAFTTHIVCGEPRRTLNLLRGIAGGCWILSKEWVLKSLEDRMWMMEENFEMVEEFPAAKECRLKRHALGKLYKADLFSHIGPIFVSNDCVPTRQDLVYLIMLCSGKVANSKQRASLFLGMEHMPDKTVVKPTWILDSVMKMSLQDPGDYVIPATTRLRESSPEF